MSLGEPHQEDGIWTEHSKVRRILPGTLILGAEKEEGALVQLLGASFPFTRKVHEEGEVKDTCPSTQLPFSEPFHRCFPGKHRLASVPHSQVLALPYGPEWGNQRVEV
ncbi:hypothetical protein TREES_T100005345 [Tupaia chinensis]|uniref:Uncharacterized protein n=1 Tax=Tupaia chinensis TaxID=246437 RepID=L9KWR2_TUPCH|nr:hypothetical protein TREES_T100005345 [Tupaia chinensis]